MDAAPRSSKPFLQGTVRCEANWQFTLTGGRQAHNIFYVGFPPLTDTASVTNLQGVANSLFSLFTNTIDSLMASLSAYITLENITVSDNGGSDLTATSTFTGVPGGDNTDICMPPNCAITVSWNIASRYRGGHPRWYLAGFPTNALLYQGGSQVSSTIATKIKSWATYILANQSSIAIGANLGEIGTVRYSSGKVPLVPPVFYPFLAAEVHERLDSQRRRLGKESGFPVA